MLSRLHPLGVVQQSRQLAAQMGSRILLVCALLALPQVSRGDHIDEELLKQAPKLVKTLQDKGYTSVGVLKFLVKAGKGPSNPNIGPLNMVMATRVENALIHGASSSHPIAVVRDATQIAANANPKYSTETKAGREAFFGYTYPMAWGNSKVTPDAFLTGAVALSPDMRKTSVSIYSFDKKDPTLHKVLGFEVETDRSILADSGQSFVLSRTFAKKTRSVDELDDSAADSAAAADAGKPVTQQASGDIPLKFEIRYNDVVQAITQDPGSFGEMRVDPPQKGDVVTFNVTNVTREKVKIGLLVKINGESTMGQETGEDADCQKWILVPDKLFTLRGFYNVAENKVTPFKVLDDDESAARMAEWSGSRPRAGYIDVTVFSEGASELTVATNDTSSDEVNAADAMMVGRKLRGFKAEKHKPASHMEARRLIDGNAKHAAGKHKKNRGLVVAGDTTEDGNISDPDNINNPTSCFQLQINYYKPAGG